MQKTYLSKALVAALTATSTAPNKDENADILMYCKLSFLTSIGTKASAKLSADAAIAIDMMVPKTAWDIINVFESPILDVIVRESLSPIMTNAALGRPSLITSVTTPM